MNAQVVVTSLSTSAGKCASRPCLESEFDAHDECSWNASSKDQQCIALYSEWGTCNRQFAFEIRFSLVLVDQKVFSDVLGIKLYSRRMGFPWEHDDGVLLPSQPPGVFSHSFIGCACVYSQALDAGVDIEYDDDDNPIITERDRKTWVHFHLLFMPMFLDVNMFVVM